MCVCVWVSCAVGLVLCCALRWLVRRVAATKETTGRSTARTHFFLLLLTLHTPPNMPAITRGAVHLLLLAVLAALTTLTTTSLALTDSAAAAFDSYVPRLGVPLSSDSPSLSLSPRYHRLLPHGSGNVQGGKAQTAIFSASDSRIVSAVNPRNGNIVWRQHLDDDVQGFWLDGETAVVVTGQGGQKVHLFHALSGWNLWTRQLAPPAQGRLANDDARPALPASDVAFLPTPDSPRWDVVVLNNGDTVRRLEVENGKELWRFSRSDNGIDRYASA